MTCEHRAPRGSRTSLRPRSLLLEPGRPLEAACRVLRRLDQDALPVPDLVEEQRDAAAALNRKVGGGVEREVPLGDIHLRLPDRLADREMVGWVLDLLESCDVDLHLLVERDAVRARVGVVPLL